jgi:hypothetical protein
MKPFAAFARLKSSCLAGQSSPESVKCPHIHAVIMVLMQAYERLPNCTFHFIGKLCGLGR